MKPVKALKKEEKAIGDLKRQHITSNNRRQQHVMSSPNRASANISLGYYRGLGEGRIEGVEACIQLPGIGIGAKRILKEYLKTLK